MQTLMLTNCGDSKLLTIKIIKDLLGNSLKESKDLVDNTPSIIFDTNSRSHSCLEYAKQQLENAGATCIILNK